MEIIPSASPTFELNAHPETCRHIFGPEIKSRRKIRSLKNLIVEFVEVFNAAGRPLRSRPLRKKTPGIFCFLWRLGKQILND